MCVQNLLSIYSAIMIPFKMLVQGFAQNTLNKHLLIKQTGESTSLTLNVLMMHYMWEIF